ncbi:MAG: hypothetical protein IPJ13_19555 [Saprospiraceae bacterium]|nr:hypothetical protein [Saprospiraceae bacterium]
MKTIFKIILLMVLTNLFWMDCIAFSAGDEISAYAKHTCSQTSADGVIDLTVTDANGPYDVTYFSANMVVLYDTTFTAMALLKI